MSQPTLMRLRPRHDLNYVSRNHTVLATDLDGFVRPGPERGLFFHETRLLSRYRYLINGAPPKAVALANVEQHSWLGYYIAPSPNAGKQGEFETLGPGASLRSNQSNCVSPVLRAMVFMRR